MNATNKNKIRSLIDFLRYRRGEMSGNERNSFEKELQKDPFAEEASEGFSLITAEEAEKDLSDLKKRIDRKTKKRPRAIYYSAVAAVTVLVTISVIFFNNNKEKELIISKNNVEEVKAPLVIAASEPITDKSKKSDLGNKSRTQSPSPPLPASPVPAAGPALAKAEEKEADNKVTNTDETMADKVQAMDSEVLKKDLIVVSAQEEGFVQPAEAEKKMEASKIAGVSVSASRSAKSKSATDYIPPQPVTGTDSFNIYLENNILNPEPGNDKEELVIISFIVKADSTITELKIITSPGPSYSREAKRLIKEGPVWKPAMENGNPVEEEYRVSILFR